jgi:DNA-binding GntR family transcriptional regulator
VAALRVGFARSQIRRQAIASVRPINLRTHKLATYEALRDMIVAFELPPGERLVEQDLASRLGVSKTPVREALALLEGEGLVELIPYRGAIVRWLSRNQIAEQGFLVDALEMPAYPIVVARISDAELDAIDRLAEDLVRARRNRDEIAYGEIVVRIHLALFACTGFPRLVDLIRLVVGPVGLRYDKALVYPFDESWDALLELALSRIRAIRTRDAGTVRDTVLEHRRRLVVLNEVHLADPAVARYFRDP